MPKCALLSLQMLDLGTWASLVPLWLLLSDPIHVHRQAPSPRRRVGSSARGGDRTDIAGQQQACHEVTQGKSLLMVFLGDGGLGLLLGQPREEAGQRAVAWYWGPPAVSPPCFWG